MLYTDKYKPKKIDDIIGNEQVRTRVRQWILNWLSGKRQRALLLSGSPGIEDAIRLDMKLDSEGSQSSRMDMLRHLCPAMASIKRIVSSYLSQRSAEDALEDRGSNVGTQLVKRTVSKSGRQKLKDFEKRLLELDEDEMEEVEGKGTQEGIWINNAKPDT